MSLLQAWSLLHVRTIFPTFNFSGMLANTTLHRVSAYPVTMLFLASHKAFAQALSPA